MPARTRTLRSSLRSLSRRAKRHLRRGTPAADFSSEPLGDPVVFAGGVLAAADQAGVLAFAIPLRWNAPVRIGISRTDAPQILRVLARQHPTWVATIRSDGQPWARSRTVPLSDSVALLNGLPKAIYVHGSPGIYGNRGAVLEVAGAVEVELWEASDSGDWNASFRNLHCSSIRPCDPKARDTVTIRGAIMPTVPDFCAPTAEQIPYPIDAVYLWVDGSDPSWRDRQAFRRSALAADSPLRSEAVSDSRFADHDELRYSLRSLFRYAPWIRHVYLVTDQQVPDWLDQGFGRVTVVDHTQILPGDALPTYNSHALSAAAHRIPGLSEHFLYMNDDVFFGRPVDPGMWFAHDGTVLLHHTSSTGPGGSVRHVSVPVSARRNAVALLEKDFPDMPAQRRNLQHGPHPVRRSIMEEIWTRYRDPLERTQSNPFRTEEDVEPIWLHNGYARATGRAAEGPAVSYSYVLMSDPDTDAVLTRLLDTRATEIFCLNDDHGEDTVVMTPADQQKRYRTFLPAYYPHPSPAEATRLADRQTVGYTN